MASLDRIVCCALVILVGIPGCRRSESDKREAEQKRIRAARLARQRAAVMQQPIVKGGTVVIPAQPGGTSSGTPGDGDVYTDGKGHFIEWDVQKRGKAAIHWGRAKRWHLIHNSGVSSKYSGGRYTWKGLNFRDSRIRDPRKRRLEYVEPGRLRLSCGDRKVGYTALSRQAASQAKAGVTRVGLPSYRRPEVLLRLAGTQSYIYVDQPAVTFGKKRVFWGRARALKQLTLQRFVGYMDGGSQRLITNRGAIWLPVSMGGPPRQPTFTPTGGQPQRLVAVPAKVGDALRRIIGDRLYADLKAKTVASPCDPYLSPAATVSPPQTYVRRTPESAPRLTLHVLAKRTLKQVARHALTQPVGTGIWSAEAPDAFWTRGWKGPPALLVYRPGQGLHTPQKLPQKLGPLVRSRKTYLEVLHGNKRQKITLPGNKADRLQGHLINGGRSLVVLRQRLFDFAGSGPGELWFIADLRRPKLARLPIKLGRNTQIATARDKRRFYVATGPLRGPVTFHEVAPARRRVRRLTALGVVQRNSVLKYLPRAGVLVLRGHSRDDFITLYDIQKRRAHKVRLPRDRQGLRVYSRGKRPELISVMDQLIDVRTYKIVSTIAGLVSISASVHDRRASLLYYTTSATGGLDYTRVRCFDLRRGKLLGYVDLKQVGHHRSSKGALNLDRVYALQLRPDGSVLAVAGGRGQGRAQTGRRK